MAPPAGSRVVAVGGARDGVGKTTFAVNLALSFLKETRERVLLIELDRAGAGDSAALLGLTEVRTIADFAPYLGQLTPETVGPYIAAHPAGLGLLPLAASPEAADKVPLDAVKRMLELCLPLASYIVVDCGAGVDPFGVAAMEKSSGIFLVTTPDFNVLQATRRMIDQLQQLQFPQQLVKVVVNRLDAAGPITKELVLGRLGRPVLVTLPKDDTLTATHAARGTPFVLDAPREKLTRHYDELARQLVEKGVLDQLGQLARPQDVGVADARRQVTADDKAKEVAGWMKSRGGRGGRGGQKGEIDGRTAVKMLIHKRLVEVLDLKRLDRELANNQDRDKVLRERAEVAISRVLDEEGGTITDRADRQRIVKEVLDEALGLGPLEDLLADDRVTEVMVNGRDNVFVEIGGKLQKTNLSFTDDQQLLAVIERIVQPLGRRVDEKSPMVDARLPDGSRVNAVIPPLAIDGPSITIRKFAKEPYKVADLVKFGAFTPELADLLRACVEARLNILISGGTGSGKTTLLNVLSSFIPPDERIVTVEDAAELQLKQPHVVRMESRPPNIEGIGEVKIRDLVKNCLRMRPDRIVVGECRGAEALDMLQAMNTGHDGSLTTVHSNSPRDAISRLETLVMFAGLDLPSRAIREQIGSAVHIIVQTTRMSDGSRKVISVAEVTGMEANTITLQEIFSFKQTGLDANKKVMGHHAASGFVPKFVSKLDALGIELPRGIFSAPPMGPGAVASANNNAPIPRGRP
ncbi:MAG: ATPase, T2SS/T4P/T4SS family [Myxococcota bacterium]